MINNKNIKLFELLGVVLIIIGLSVEGLLVVFAAGLGIIMVSTIMIWVRIIQRVRIIQMIRMQKRRRR